jgi:hypothetical protein
MTAKFPDRIRERVTGILLPHLDEVDHHDPTDGTRISTTIVRATIT